MAAETNILSQSINALDNGSPGSPAPGKVSAGQGGPGKVWEVDDYVNVTGSGPFSIQSAGSYYRLLRIPTAAMIKELYLSFNTALDSNAANTLAFVLGIAFSDSQWDGTQPYQAGLIPTTANDGATTTSFASFVNPNNLFGTLSAATLGHAAAPFISSNLVLNGSGATYLAKNILSAPLWTLFGFVDGVRGLPMQPSGMFDIYAYASVGAATGVSGMMHARASYVL
jgi:hypothetical protein